MVRDGVQVGKLGILNFDSQNWTPKVSRISPSAKLLENTSETPQKRNGKHVFLNIFLWEGNGKCFFLDDESSSPLSPFEHVN